MKTKAKTKTSAEKAIAQIRAAMLLIQKGIYSF